MGSSESRRRSCTFRLEKVLNLKSPDLGTESLRVMSLGFSQRVVGPKPLQYSRLISTVKFPGKSLLDFSTGAHLSGHRESDNFFRC